MSESVSKTEKKSVRQKLVDCAYEHFNKNGIHKTGINQIIKDAGVARMSLYAHFPSKQDLVLEYLRIREDEWFALLDSFIAKAEEPEDKLVQVFEALKVWFEDENFYGCPFISGLAEFEENESPEVSQCISLHFERTGELVADILAGMGQDKADLAGKVSMVIVGAIVLAQATKSFSPAIMAKEITMQMFDK